MFQMLGKNSSPWTRGCVGTLRSGQLKVGWMSQFQTILILRVHVSKLDAKKPVIICGDFNVAHEEIDLKNPKTNKKNAGFTQEERDGFTDLLNAGFVDTFRHFKPDEKDAYTFWTYMMGCR